MTHSDKSETVALTADTRAWLSTRADRAGRSISEEIEFILYHVRFSSALAAEFTKAIEPLMNMMSKSIDDLRRDVRRPASRAPAPPPAPAAPQADDQWVGFEDLKRLGIVANRTTLSRWRKIGGFPAGINLGPNTVRWRLADIRLWQAERCNGTPPRA